MSKDPAFLLLKPAGGWLEEKWWTKILGSVVLNPYAPANDYTPKNPLVHNKNDLSEPKFEGMILQKENIEIKDGKAEVTGLGGFRGQKSFGTSLDLRGKMVYVKRLTGHREFWKEMTTADPAVAKEVAGWVNEKRGWLGLGGAKYEVCWVVGLLMCQDVAVAASDKQAKEWEGQGEFQLGTIIQTVAAAHGAVVPTGGACNVTAAAASKTANHHYFAIEGQGKYVFALELKIVSLKKGKPVPTDKQPKSEPSRQLGSDDEDVVEPEDLVMKDRPIKENEWEMLLQEYGKLEGNPEGTNNVTS